VKSLSRKHQNAFEKRNMVLHSKFGFSLLLDASGKVKFVLLSDT